MMIGQFLRIVTFVLAAVTGSAQAYESTVFYIVGHQDDWQLFMSPNAYYDAQGADVKTVFIYMTAGDAGRGDGAAEEGRTPYFRARDIGAEAAMQFVATREGQFRTETSWHLVFTNGHLLPRWQYNNAVAYFFHLPDGFPAGTGHPNTGWQSLQRLESNAIDTITDIHERNIYTGWTDLVYTVRSIVLNEATGSSNVWVNIPNTMADPGNGSSSPTEDHSDHIYSGRLMLDAINDLPCINSARFYGYQTGHRDSNLNEDQTIIAAATWGATIAGLLSTDGARNTFGTGHNQWVAKRYFDVVNGSGDCDFRTPPVVEIPGIYDPDRLRGPVKIPGVSEQRFLPGPFVLPGPPIKP